MSQASLVVVADNSISSLSALIDRAVSALNGARTSAEVLEARELAELAYDAAKRAARMGKAKRAHDSLIAAAHRAQADALEIEAQAKRRLADEYDAAQERGEVRGPGQHGGNISDEYISPRVSDLGLTHVQIQQAREIRDAEVEDPGIVRRTLDEALDAGEEPTRTKVKRAVKAKSKRKRHARPNLTSPAETQHDRDLRALLGVWESTCESAREAFLEIVVQ